jgi:hypothetical protein
LGPLERDQHKVHDINYGVKLTASAGLPVGVAGVPDAFVDVGLAVDLVGAADDVLPPGLPEPARARIFAAACSARTTM